MHHYAEIEHHPAQAWYVITGVGVLTAALLLLYDRLLKPTDTTT
jgi:proton-dependent oligopeptide transporter, POT family